MKVLHINTLHKKGGAARAVVRLHQSLLLEGADSQMLVQYNAGEDNTVDALATSRISKHLSIIRTVLDQLLGKRYKNWRRMLFSPSYFGSTKIVRKVNQLNPDIVHLHWICHAMIRIKDIKKIQPPIVWSLHDMWAFSGGCHYDQGCGKYISHCGECPVLKSNKKKDISYRVFKEKEKTFSHIPNMTIVGLSKWLSQCAKESALLKNKQHVCLPNAIDTKSFKPISKTLARKHHHLPQHKKLILFGAMNATSDPNKGFQQLLNALKSLSPSPNVEVVVFGADTRTRNLIHGFPIHFLGKLGDNEGLIMLYNAADITVVPSLQENLSNVIMESLSCATPIVAFNIGGNRDLIHHKKNGYLAVPYNTKDLAAGIEWVLHHPHYKDLCINAREEIIQNFDYTIVSKKYIQLYEKIIQRRAQHKRQKGKRSNS